MNETCGCCDGITQLTPVAIANRPGLNALAYRVGTHGAFLETMKARLSNFYLDIRKEMLGQDGQPQFERIYPLRGLTTRVDDDPSIALLDAWAIVGDVLTFYQERIANEGYLRTATERRSILELARLVGYALRPGVAATVYLAYTLDSNFKDEVVIPVGARVQSVPGPGELPQSFETSEPLAARAAWNVLKPRMTRPQTEQTISDGDGPRVYLKGISTNLKPNDPLLIDFGTGTPVFVRVKDVQPDGAADRTLVTLQDWRAAPPAQAMVSPEAISIDTKRQLNAIIARYLGEEADKIGLSRDTKMFKTVSEHLGALQEYLAEEVPFPSLIAHFNSETLPKLDAEREIAERLKYRDLQPWLENMLAELNTVAEGASIMRAEALAREFTLPAPKNGGNAVVRAEPFTPLIGGLAKPPSVPPANALQLKRSVDVAFQPQADTGLQIVGTFKESLRAALPVAVGNAKVTPDVQVKVYALRVKAAPFGSNAPKEPQYEPRFIMLDTGARQENDKAGQLRPQAEWPEWVPAIDENSSTIFLNGAYDQILPGSYIAIQRPDQDEAAIFTIVSVTTPARSAYGLNAPTTKIALPAPWWDPDTDPPQDPELDSFAIIRGTTVYAQSEELALAEEPIDTPICGSSDASDPSAFIELDGVYSELQAGRWLIVSGERTDIQVPDPDNPGKTVPVPGVKSTELVMLAEVVQRVSEADQAAQASSYYGYGPQPVRGEKIHTFIRLAQTLEYCYKRDAVTIYGNVVKATHGETRNEVLGSGDGSQALQSFTLKQPPLTFVAAPNPRGVDSTLHVRVNDVEWHETDSLAGLGPTDRKFITRTDDDDKTTVIFGNGRQGARLPTGAENVKAVYRNGIGKPGNVKAEQISLLATRPLGVKEVINPLRASGGADKESRDQARKNAPLAVLALDRLVSTQDYEDFTRARAGIGKASAARLTDGRRQLVFVTIAGADDIPIDKTSDLYRNLVVALRQFGDPHQPVQVELRELLLIVISANVRLLPDYLWEAVAPKIRAQLLDTFSFERRELAQDVVLSEVIRVIQAVEGVAYVDVDMLRGIPEKTADAQNPGQRRLLTPAEITAKIKEPLIDARGNATKEPLARLTANPAGFEAGAIRPAQLAFLTPDVPATLILNEIK
jgi:hypothetical protein